MKFKIEVELDWIGEEDGSLDDELKKAVAATIVKQVSEQVKADVSAKVKDRIESMVDGLVKETYDEIINRPIVLRDSWGDKRKEFPNIRDLVKERFDAWLNEMTDSSGRASDYHAKKRVEWIIKDQLSNMSADFTKKAIEEVVTNIKKTLSEDLKAALGERVFGLIGVDTLVAKGLKS